MDGTRGRRGQGTPSNLHADKSAENSHSSSHSNEVVHSSHAAPVGITSKVLVYPEIVHVVLLLLQVCHVKRKRKKKKKINKQKRKTGRQKLDRDSKILFIFSKLRLGALLFTLGLQRGNHILIFTIIRTTQLL